jgi:hypothetical protein
MNNKKDILDSQPGPDQMSTGKYPTRRDALKASGVATLALIFGKLAAACGEEPTPICETPEREMATAPKVKIDRVELQGTSVRAFFETPNFDVDCKGPLRVTLMANVRSNRAVTGEDGSFYGDGEQEPVVQPTSSTISLGEKEVWQSGDDIVEGVLPTNWDVVDSVTLKVVDAQGTEFETPTKILN